MKQKFTWICGPCGAFYETESIGYHFHIISDIIDIMKKQFIGDRAFYRMLLKIAVPIIIQQGITQFVNMLDNIMVGQVGTLAMSGVSIANELLLILMLSIFGTVSAVSIFSAQYFGQQNYKGVHQCFRIKFLLLGVLTAAAAFVYLVFGKQLISFYMNPDANTPQAITETAGYAWNYMRIMVFGYIPFAVCQIFSSTVRESGETVLPMYASVSAVLTNLVFNYILIFGHFGLPALGSTGAAVATVISRFVELGVITAGLALHRENYPFLEGIAEKTAVPASLLKRIVIKGAPLVLNEILWSLGMALITQCYSMKGLEAIAAVNIMHTVGNIFRIINIALGNSISIIVGQQLGAGETELAAQTNTRIIFAGTCLSAAVGVILLATSGLYPQLYNTSAYVRETAAALLRITAVMLPVNALYMASYFTLRTGGKTVITFLSDCGYTWAVTLVLAFFLTRRTSLGIVGIFMWISLADLPKVAIGMWLLKKRVWINRLVETV